MITCDQETPTSKKQKPASSPHLASVSIDNAENFKNNTFLFLSVCRVISANVSWEMFTGPKILCPHWVQICLTDIKCRGTSWTVFWAFYNDPVPWQLDCKSILRSSDHRGAYAAAFVLCAAVKERSRQDKGTGSPVSSLRVYSSLLRRQSHPAVKTELHGDTGAPIKPVGDTPAGTERRSC